MRLFPYYLLLTALLFSGCTQTKMAATSLQHRYAQIFLIGSAVNTDLVNGQDLQGQALLLKHFNCITAENVLKAETLLPQPNQWRFQQADAFVDFAQKHQLKRIGHTLVWHNQTPDWFFKNALQQPNTPAQQKAFLRTYIQQVAGRYAGRINAWDVVNEVMGEDGQYRPTTWVNAFGSGDELVKAAFQFTQEFAPNTELYYNDFNAWRPSKRNGIIRMVKMLQKEGIRIDGIGMQGHWGLNYPSIKDIEDAIDAYASLGVKVMITELDVDVLPLTREGQVIGQVFNHPQFQYPEFKTYLDPYRLGLPDSVQRQLTQRYAELFALFYRKRDKIDRVSLWGIHDTMSWKNNYPVAGRTNYPLLFDRNYQAKPAVEAILKIPK